MQNIFTVQIYRKREGEREREGEIGRDRQRQTEREGGGGGRKRERERDGMEGKETDTEHSQSPISRAVVPSGHRPSPIGQLILDH